MKGQKEEFLPPIPPVARAPLPPAQKSAPPPFVKPSVKEAEDYMLTQKELCPSALTARAQALRFINYYESNGWKVGRNAMQDWRAATNNWLLNAQTYDTKNSRTHAKIADCTANLPTTASHSRKPSSQPSFAEQYQQFVQYAQSRVPGFTQMPPTSRLSPRCWLISTVIG